MKTNWATDGSASVTRFAGGVLTADGRESAVSDVTASVRFGFPNRVGWLIPPAFGSAQVGPTEVIAPGWYDTGWCLARVAFWTDARWVGRLTHAARALLRVERGARETVAAIVLEHSPEPAAPRVWEVRAVVVGVIRDGLGLFPTVPVVSQGGSLGERTDRSRFSPEPVVADLGREEVAPLFVVEGSPGES